MACKLGLRGDGCVPAPVASHFDGTYDSIVQDLLSGVFSAILCRPLRNYVF